MLLEKTAIPFITNNEDIYTKWLHSLRTFAENENARGNLEIEEDDLRKLYA